MNILFLIFFFIFGSIIGSFLNVVLFRYNTGRTVGGRSKCFSCKRTLGPIDLVPIFSFLAFRGKCRTCKSHISFQYPAVELITGLLFAGVYALNEPLIFLNTTLFMYNIAVALVVMALLVLITVYDFKHKIIPDAFAYTFAVVSFVAMFIQVSTSEVQQFYVAIPEMSQLFAGVILAFPFYFLWLVSRGQWMGLGDAKLALGIGWFLGLAKGGTAIIYGFWIGALLSVLIIICRPEISPFKRFPLVSLTTFAISLYKIDTIGYYWIAIFVSFYALYILTKSSYGKKLIDKGIIPNLSAKSEIPFAPFLVAGLLIVYFFGYNTFSILSII
ncbi:MAG: prepilin peptidase [Candidatus Pacebacteria bacterium]|nr:prepilin peptidase [Candidatus Paceibacterota bacterium]